MAIQRTYRLTFAFIFIFTFILISQIFFLSFIPSYMNRANAAVTAEDELLCGTYVIMVMLYVRAR